MSKDPNAFYHYLNVFSEYILVTVGLKIMGNATNVATNIFREQNYIKIRHVWSGVFCLQKNIHGMFWLKKTPNATVKIHNNTASGVCVWACVISMFGVGRFEVIKQQDLCSDRMMSKIHRMKKSLFLLKKKGSQPAWKVGWIFGKAQRLV